MSGRDDALHSLLSSATLVAVGGLVGSFSKLLERVIIGRTLSPDAYGEVSIGIVILSIASTLALLGYSQAVSRYISRYDSVRDVRGVWVTGVGFTGVLAVCLTALLFYNADFLVSTLFKRTESVTMVQLFVLTIPFTVLFNVAVNAIRGFENTIYKTIAKDLLFPAVRIGAVVWLLAAGYGVLAAGYAYLFATVVAFVVAHVLLYRLVPLVGEFKTHFREMTKFSAPLVVATMLSMLLARTDMVMLGYFSTSYDVGQYAAAYPIAQGMLIVLTSFGFLYLPLASRLDADGDREEIDRIFKTITKWIYVVTFPAFLTFAVFSEDVVRIFFGPAYAPASLALAILSVGFFANAVGGRNRETLSALGHTNYLLVGNGSAYALNVVLNLVLIPQYSFAGAAIASAASLICLNVVTLGILAFKFDISPFSSSAVRAFVALPVCLLPPAFLLSHWVSLTRVTLLPFLGLTGLLSIVVVSVAGGLQSEDFVVVEFVEDRLGVEIPFVRGYLQPE